MRTMMENQENQTKPKSTRIEKTDLKLYYGVFINCSIIFSYLKYLHEKSVRIHIW